MVTGLAERSAGTHMDCPTDPVDHTVPSAALRESEERFRNTFENAAVGMAHISTEGRWLRVNQKVSEIVGYDPEELSGLTFQDITHPDDLEIDLGLLDEVIRGERDTYRIEKRYFRKDGEMVWVNLTVGCVRNAAGEVDYFISVLEDITEQKRVHRALFESEARFRAVQQTSPDGFLMYSSVRNDEGRIVDFRCEFANPAAARLSGMETREMIGSRLLEALPDHREMGLFDVFRRVVETGEVAEDEIAFPALHNGSGWVRYSVVKMADGFAVSFSDITARKQTGFDLKQSEFRLRTFQQTSPDGFMTFQSVRDSAGRITDFRIESANPSAVRIVGRPSGEIIGHTMREIMPGSIANGMFDKFVRLVGSGGVWHEEFLYNRPAGDQWLRITAVRVNDGFAVSFSDITSRKDWQRKLEESDERLRAIMDNVVAFIGLLSPDGIVLEANETALSAAGIARDDAIGRPFWETYWWSHDAALVQTVRESVIRAAKGERVRHDVDIRAAGDTRMAVDFQLSPIFDENGRVTHIVPSGYDISDRKKAEEHREMLVRELSHRVKNSLATVQAIASHTLRDASDLETFRDSFMGRLRAIAACHDLLVAPTRSDANVLQLVRDQVTPYSPPGSDRVQMSGPPLVIGANAAHAFGLVLHELATNAAKHGALSNADGRIRIVWDEDSSRGRRDAVVEWEETGGPVVSDPTRKGFGSFLIEHSLAHSLGGASDIEYRPEGLKARFRFPISDGK